MMRSAPLALLACLLWPSPASADLIDFTQLSLGPSNTLEYMGVTISGENGGHVAMVRDQGLGLADIGAAGSIDGVFYMDSPHTPSPGWEKSLSIAVDGRINSVTIQPYFFYAGPVPTGGAEVPGFPLFLRAEGPGGLFGAYGWGARDLRNDAATITFPPIPNTPGGIDFRPTTLTNIGLLIPDATWDQVFRPFWLSQNKADMTFSFGYSITSMDYTPTPTPEPASLLLISLGIAGVGLVRRRIRRAPRAGSASARD